ncbi:MAG TPA: aspartate aminotransferase family protein [Myxococcaceae bacterium]|nr:aspartate aminotransferase family protein [Myxococcaceae bacterium]
MAQEAIIERAKAHLLQNYRTQPVVIDRGQGTRVWDADGKSYLDLLGGIATCAMGHCHPEVVKALKAQADKLWHISNVFYSQPQIDLAEMLTQASGLERAFFCNSGAEANEALIKLARKVQKDRGQADRFEIICFDNSFHGRTLATVTATGQTKYQKGFEPLPPGFLHVPYGELDAVRHAVTSHTAAVLVEPIQGEGGVRPAPEGFLRALRQLCDERGLLLLVDEIQTGMGRTGKLFAFQHEDVRPDAISMAKALGNGIPIGAMLCSESCGKSLSAGTHGSTFGGNLLAVEAAKATFKLIADPKLLQSVTEKGEYFQGQARKLLEQHPQHLAAVRGRGLLWGIEVKGDAGKVVARCRDLGLLVNLAGEKTVRFAPPFIVTREELDEGLRIFARALAD